MSSPTGANRVVFILSAYMVAPSIVYVTRMRFGASSLVCPQFESRRTATDCIFPIISTRVAAWTLALVGVTRLTFQNGDCECVGFFDAVFVGPFASISFCVQKSRGFVTKWLFVASNPGVLASIRFVNDNDKSIVNVTATVVMIYEKMP